MTLKQIQSRLYSLGYALIRNYPDKPMNRTVPYVTLPINRPGTINHFQNKKDIESYILQVEQKRLWENAISAPTWNEFLNS